MNKAQRLFPVAALGILTAFNFGCPSDDDGSDDINECSYADPAGADCTSCQQLGDCCEFSINCPAGAICNIEGDPLFDATQESAVCLKVVCDGDQDCESPKTCSLEKLCKPPICQSSDACPGGQVCIAGVCQDGPPVEDVTACEVVTRATAIREGARLALSAVARNTNGAVLPTIGFVWESANANAVAVDGEEAIGGTEQGTSALTAKVAGKESVTCNGSVSITNFPNVPAADVRVVLVADDDGSPVADAQVFLEAGGSRTATTGADGSATFAAVGAAVDSVTVIKNGWQYVSVLQPGGNDVFIPLPRIPDETVAGGFRGNVDLSATRKADIQLGIAGPAIPSNLLDFGLDALIGDSVPTVIDAPELGLDMENVDLPGGVLLGLGNKKFTVDGSGARCQGDAVGTNDIGCFLARAPAGPSAGWVLAGQLKLSQVTSIANELSNAIGGTGGGDVEIGSILTAVLPLVRSLNHGAVPSLNIEEFPKVPVEGMQVDCSDPANAGDSDLCQADFSQYQKADMAASQSLGVLSRVSVPDLPDLPGGGCATGALILSGVNLEGRGLVPLGLTAGVDELDMEGQDCKVAGVEKPFGDQSPDLNDGQMPLSMAPPHSGMEGSQLFILMIALDLDSLTADEGFQLSAIVNRVDSVGEDHNVTGSYLGYPQGTVDRGAATVSLSSPISGAQLQRVELQSGDDTWLIYAPASATSITLPQVAPARQIVQNLGDAYLLGMGMDGSYGDIWSFGSGKTLDRMFSTANSFVVQQCSTDAGSLCTIQ